MVHATVKSAMITLDLPSQEQLAIWGEITVRHAQLDYLLRMTIKTLTGVTAAEANDALRYVGSGELRKRIKNLARARMKDGPELVKLQALLSRCERVTDERNQLAHGIVGRELDGDLKIQNDRHEWNNLPSRDELRAIAATIVGLIDELIDARFDGGYIVAALKSPTNP